MNKKELLTLPLPIIIGLIIVLFVFFPSKKEVTKANPLFFPPTCQTASATTTVTYMKLGTATTTLACDLYRGGVPTASQKASLLIQTSASSTVLILNTNIEYSQDGVDWYEDPGTFGIGYASTTKPYDISNVNRFTFQFASSTAGQIAGANATTATSTRVVFLPTPLRYVRAVFTATSTGASSNANSLSIWAQIVPIKEYSSNL